MAIVNHAEGIAFRKLRDMKDVGTERAEPLYRRALAICEKVLGHEHPYTILSLNNLVLLLQKQGNYSGISEIRERILGAEHPDTIQSIFDLAISFRDKGDHEKAEPLYYRILDIYEALIKRGASILPQIVYTVAASLNNLAFHSYVPSKKWAEAEFHYKKSIELFKELQSQVETANVELNLHTMHRLSGQKVDVNKVKELTQILETVNDKRAEKGQKLLKELSE